MLELQTRIAEFVMRSPWTASLTAVVSLVMGLALPAIFFWAPWVSGAAIALVWLAKGWQVGSKNTLLSLSALIVIAALSKGGDFTWGAIVGLSAIVIWLPTLLLSEVLRRSSSLNMMVLSVAAVALMLVAGMYLMIPDIDDRWVVFLNELSMQLNEMNVEQTNLPVEAIAKQLSGLMVVALISTSVISVFLARHWQAILYNKGGFQREFHGLKLGKSTAILTILLLVLSFGDGLSWQIAMKTVLVTILGLQGLAVFHCLVYKLKMSKAWLVALYVILLVPSMWLLLALLGIADNWVDFRGRISLSKGNSSEE